MHERGIFFAVGTLPSRLRIGLDCHQRPWFSDMAGCRHIASSSGSGLF